MTTQHTPGLWEVQSTWESGKLLEIWVDTDPRAVGDFKTGRIIVARKIYGKNEEERIQNSKLIAAAPELLDALERGYAELEEQRLLASAQGVALPMSETFLKTKAQMFKAIAKAKGEL